MVTHGNIEYKLKQAQIEGMNSHINMNKILNIKADPDDEGPRGNVGDGVCREQYSSLVLGLMNRLPGLVKQEVAPSETDFLQKTRSMCWNPKLPAMAL